MPFCVMTVIIITLALWGESWHWRTVRVGYPAITYCIVMKEKTTEK